jgi:hypothetical protein
MTYTLTLDDNDLAIIAAGLGELQFKVCKATFDKINSQVTEQAISHSPPKTETT